MRYRLKVCSPASRWTLLAATYARRDGQLYLSVETLARVQVVVSWFRQHPEERGKVISPDQAANSRTYGAKEQPR